MAMRIEIIGNLGHGAEVKDINGRECLSFDVAPSRGGREGGDTMWVSCLYYNTRVAEWLVKGRQVFIRGDYRDRLYTKRDGTVGVDRSVMVTELDLLGGGEDRAQGQSPNPAPAQGYRQPNRPTPTVAQEMGLPKVTGGTPVRQFAQAPKPAPKADDEDDLPF